MPEAEHESVILELVRSHAAAVLGHTTPDTINPNHTFLETGFTSLTGLEFRNSLSRDTGLQLPITLVIDEPTVKDVVAYLHNAVSSEMAGQVEANGSGVTASTRSNTQSTFAAMLDYAQSRGTADKIATLLMAASEFRPAFAAAEELSVAPRVLSVSNGSELPRLICLPSFVVGWVPQQFARFARAFDGRRSVAAMSLPGFRPGEPVPGSREALVDVLARSVCEAAAGDPFILVGYSIGGALAHCIAEQLERKNVTVSGLVLIDTYESLDGDTGELLSCVIGPVLQRAGQFVSVDDYSLTAVGAYARLFSGWQPDAIAAPSLLLAASQPLGAELAESRLLGWQMADDTVEVQGNHFELIEDRAEATASVVERWIVDGLASNAIRLS